jgi:hypothetical protein
MVTPESTAPLVVDIGAQYRLGGMGLAKPNWGEDPGDACSGIYPSGSRQLLVDSKCVREQRKRFIHELPSEFRVERFL